MIRQSIFAVKCVKVGDLKAARDRHIGGSMSGCRGMAAAGCLLMAECVEKILSGRRTKFLGIAGAFLRERPCSGPDDHQGRCDRDRSRTVCAQGRLFRLLMPAMGQGPLNLLYAAELARLTQLGDFL